MKSVKMKSEQKLTLDTVPDNPDVMVLSMEKAAAGMNLVHAQHVLFVHPMSFETTARAVAQRKQ